MATANKITFICVNFVELMLLIVMLYKIKDIKDELNIKVELNFLIILWLLFSMIYFISNNVFDAQETYEDPMDYGYSPARAWIIFSAILIRNISIILVSTIYCFIWSRKKEL